MTASAPKPCPFHVGRDLTAFDGRAGAFHGAKDTTRNFDLGEGVDIIDAQAGASVRRLGDGVRQARGGARGPRHAPLEGFDLHANVWVGAHDRARLEQVCRYVLRPPLAETRLRRLADGRVRLELKRPWSDGTTYLLFEPVELLEKLAALTPRPKINLVLYHGLLAPRARWRPDVVAYRRTERDRATEPRARGEGAPSPATGRGLC